jgi:hypothetical protein
MKIRRVSRKLFEPPAGRPATVKPETPAQRRRRELESSLQEAIDGASHDAAAAFVVTLEPDEKLSGVRSAFKRVKGRADAAEVNLVTVDGTLYIARTPQRRGRRPKAG